MPDDNTADAAAAPQQKHCPKCQRTLTRSDFYQNARTRDGLHGWCKECWRADCTARRAALAAAAGPKPKRVAHNKGKPMSAAAKAKLSAAKTGTRLSDEARAKIGDASRGRRFSEEHRGRISAGLKAAFQVQPKPTGWHHDEATKARIGAAHRGRTHSAEVRANMAAAARARPKRVRRVPECHPERKHAARGMCLQCWHAMKYAENREASLAYSAAWSKAHPEKRRAVRNRSAKKYPEKTAISNRRVAVSKYGMTIAQYDDLLAKQGGRCAVCRSPCRVHKRLSIDHNHATGVVRGLLCHGCNVGIGFLRDRPDLLRRAARYLSLSEALPDEQPQCALAFPIPTDSAKANSQETPEPPRDTCSAS